jgi:hypothetical protein
MKPQVTFVFFLWKLISILYFKNVIFETFTFPVSVPDDEFRS